MKIKMFLVALVASFLHIGTVFCAERKPEGYWYWIGMDYSDSGRQQAYVGTVDLDEEQLAKRLEGSEYILVDNLQVQNSHGRYISFTEFMPLYKSRTFLNPENVVNFVPLNPKEMGR